MLDKKAKQTRKHETSDVIVEGVREVGGAIILPARLAAQIAEEVAKRIPVPKRSSNKKKKPLKLEGSVFLDTSAIIDGRVFDVISLGLIIGKVVILESILDELKHIADSQDTVRRERGKKGLTFLDRAKKIRGVKIVVLPDGNGDSILEVDDRLIKSAKENKGRIITCDYNLEKKAAVLGVTAINIHNLANHLKVRAVPGEALHIKVAHVGKDMTQGVGYLDDGTMIVVEKASESIGHSLDVIVSRVIQTTAGRILFAKKI